jgi:uncharacterized protein (DUF2141 family)
MNNAKLLFLLIPVFLYTACARQSSPGGGPLDTIPPLVISSDPRSQQLNVRTSSLALEFNEYVTAANPKEQIIITPSIGKDYEIEARGKKVILKFKKPLEDSTTYTFNFRDAIQDITEKNPAVNLKIAFSTGTYIDSLKVEGIIRHALTQKEVKEATVAIQMYNDTFNIFTDPATFFTKTDDEGKFTLDNLKPGLYNIYAISDQNKNLFADTKSEAYGFKRDSFLLDANKKNVIINMVRLDVRPLKITSARPYNTYFIIKTTKNLKDFKITTVDDSLETYATYGADHANILLYNSFTGYDSVRIRSVLTDSINQQFDTTFYAKFSPRTATPEKFTAELANTFILAEKASIAFDLKLTKPVSKINFDSIFFQVDTITTVHFDPTNITYDEKERTILFRKSLDKALFIKPEETPPDQTKAPEKLPPPTGAKAKAKAAGPAAKPNIANRLILGKAAITSIEGDSSQHIHAEIRPQKTENLGVIIAETKIPANRTIIQLLGSDKLVKAQVLHKSTATFPDLPPGAYMLRLIVDTNGNGEWDPGNYYQRREPEEIRYWLSEKGETKITLKANHELGPLLITY